MNILSEGLATSQKNGKQPRGSRDPQVENHCFKASIGSQAWSVVTCWTKKAPILKKIKCGLAFFLAAAVDCSTFYFHYDKVNVSHNIFKN